jgi:4-carboxymuconolactone decarboxylase
MRGAPVFGPYVPMLRSPELMLKAADLAAFLRYRTSLPLRLSELAILIVARRWSQQLEWAHHAPAADKAGLAPAIIDAIGEGHRPAVMARDETVVFEMAEELERTRQLSDKTYARAVAALGETGTVELAAILGYYTLLALVMNTARTAPPDHGPRLPDL